MIKEQLVINLVSLAIELDTNNLSDEAACVRVLYKSIQNERVEQLAECMLAFKRRFVALEFETKKVKIETLPVGSKYRYQLKDEGIYTLLEIGDYFVRVQRMCGRVDYGLKGKEVHPEKQTNE